MNNEEHIDVKTATRSNGLLRAAVSLVRWGFNGAVALVIIAAASVAFLQTDVGRRLLTAQVLSLVNAEINGTFSCEDIKLDVFHGLVIVRPSLVVQGKSLLSADELQVSYDIAALVGHTTAVNQFTLVRPTINLVRGQDSVWNFSLLSSRADTTPPSKSELVLRLRDVAIIDGTIRVDDQTRSRAPVNTFDPSHLSLRHVNLQLSTLIDLGSHEYTAVINHLSLEDEISTQFDIDDASCAIHVSPGGLQIRALRVEMPRTQFALKGQVIGIDIEKEGLALERMQKHPFEGTLQASRVYGDDIRYFLPFLDVEDSYALNTDVVFTGDRVFLSTMDLRAGTAALKGSVEVTGLMGKKPLFLRVLLQDSRARYEDVRKWLTFLQLPKLDFVGTTQMKHLEMKGHPSDSLWFDINGTDDLGSFDGQMTLYLNASPMAYKLTANVRNVDLSVFEPTLGSCSLNGSVDLDGQGFTLSELRGRYAIELQRSVVADENIRSALFSFTADGQGITDIDTLAIDVTPFKQDEEDVQYDEYLRQLLAASGTIDARSDTLAYRLHLNASGLDLQKLLDQTSLPTGLTCAVDIDAKGLTLDAFFGTITAKVDEFALNDRALLPFSLNLSSTKLAAGRTFSITAPFARVSVEGNYEPTTIIESIPSIAAMLTTTAMRRVYPFTETSSVNDDYESVALKQYDAAFDIQLLDASPFNVFLDNSTISTRSAVKGRIVSDSTRLDLFLDDVTITDLLFRADSTIVTADPCTMRGQMRYSVFDSLPNAEHIDVTASCERNVFVGGNSFGQPRIKLRGNDSSLYSVVGVNANGIDALVGVTSVYRNGQLTMLVDTITAAVDKQRKLEWVSLSDAKVHVRNQTFDVTGLTLRRSDGEVLSIEGVCSLERFSNLHLQVTDFALDDVSRFVDLEEGHPLMFLNGKVRDLDLYVNGTWEKPVITMRVRADDVEYNHEIIGSLSASMRYAERDVIGKLNISNNRIPNAPNTLAIDVRHLPVDLGLRNVSQRWVDGGVIDIDLRATKLALAAVEPFLPAVERVQGLADGVVTMRGSLPSNVQLGGSAVFKNATFLTSPTNIVYRAEGSLHLEGSRLFLDTIRVRNLDRDRRGGAAVANGVVTFDGLSVSRVDFSVVSKGILIMNKGSQARNPKVFGDIVVASGSKPIMFYGPLDAPVLSGDVDVLFADIIFPQERSSTKAKYSAFIYQRSRDKQPARSVLDTTTMLRVSDNSSAQSREQAAEVITEVMKSTTAAFSDILRFNLNIYLRGRTLMTMVLGFLEILIADLEPVDAAKPLTITGRFIDNSVNMSGRVRVKEGTSTYKFYKPFSASGTLDFTQGGMGNPTLNLKAIYNGRRMNIQSNDPETYRVVIDISGTKQRPIANWSYYRNDRKQEGDSAKVTGDALMLLLLGRTQDELTSTGQGNLVNEVNSSMSAVATSALGDLLSGVGGLVQSVQMDLGSDFSQTQLTVSGQLWSDVVYRLTGQVSDFAGNSTITVTVPFTVLKNSDAMRYFNLDISRSVNNTGNITRFQRLWEIKLGARLP